MIILKEATASQEIPLGRFVDSADGDTEETGLTIANTDIKLWKNGATTLASKNSGGATHIANGVYYAVLDATDTNTLGSLVVHVHVSGALAVKQDCLVVPANIYDSLIGGSDYLQIDIAQVLGATATTTPAPQEFTSTGTPTTIELKCSSSGLPTEANAFLNMFVVMTSGTYRNVARQITASSVSGGTMTLAVDALPGAPTVGDKFIIIGKLES